MWTRVGPRNYVFDWVRIPPERGTFEEMSSGIPRMLLISVPVGRPQKQLSVTLNVANEKSPLWCGLWSKFFDPLFSYCQVVSNSADMTARKSRL